MNIKRDGYLVVPDPCKCIHVYVLTKALISCYRAVLRRHLGDGDRIRKKVSNFASLYPAWRRTTWQPGGVLGPKESEGVQDLEGTAMPK